MSSKNGKPAGKKVKRSTPEHDLQVEIFEWCRGIGLAIWPELRLIRSLTSGQARWGGQLFYYKSEGLETGYPDIHLAVGRGGFTSLWIELKAPNARPVPRADQRDRINQLETEGSLCFVLNDYESVISVIESYALGLYRRAAKPDWIPVPPALS